MNKLGLKHGEYLHLTYKNNLASIKRKGLGGNDSSTNFMKSEKDIQEVLSILAEVMEGKVSLYLLAVKPPNQKDVYVGINGIRQKGRHPCYDEIIPWSNIRVLGIVSTNDYGKTFKFTPSKKK